MTPTNRSEPSGEAPSTESNPSHTQREQAVDQFVQFWGEMASNWGINRTMAQIYALLYCATDPLNTDDIMERLQISRGNANMNLRSLVDWKLVGKVQLSGSRKDFFVAETNVWHITAQIIRERRRREIQPVQQRLKDCRALLQEEGVPCAELSEPNRELCKRFDSLIELMEVFEGFSEAILPLVEERNAPMIRQFIEMAEAMDEEAPPPGSSHSGNE